MPTADLLIHRPKVGCSSGVEEELPMTLALGYFGKESFVLIADRKRSRSLLDYSADVAKISLSDDAHLVIAAAGNYTLSRGLARRLVKIWDEGDWPVNGVETFLEEKAQAAFAAYYGTDIREKPISEQPRNGLLIFDAKKWVLYELAIFGQADCSVHTRGFVPIGHTENTALLFSERYLGAEKPIMADVSELKLLATYTVTPAAKLNPSGIGNGVDIYFCEKEQSLIQEVTNKEKASLLSLTADVDANIANLFFPHSSSLKLRNS